MGWWRSTWRPGQGVPHDDVAVSASSYLGMAGAYGSHLPDPLPGDEPVPTSRDNRPRRFPATPGGGRGRPRPPHITPTDPGIPDVPAGTLLHLLPGEWMYQFGRHPGEQIVMRVNAVHLDRARPDNMVVWVTGHELDCSPAACDAPCYDLLASVDALRRAVGRR